MKKRKSFTARFAAFVFIGILGFTLPENIYAGGWPVFDLTNMLNTLEQIYQTYDEINSMIEQVENGYKQIEQGINMVKSFNFEEMSLEDWSSEGGLKGAWENIGKSRTRLRQAGGYVSQKQEEMAAIKKKLNSNIISFNGVNYSISDLCTGIGSNGEKSIMGLARNMAGYAVDKYKTAAKGYTEGLTYNERQNIARYYGVSPEAYFLEQSVEGLVEGTIEGSLGSLAPNFTTVFSDETEQTLQELLAVYDEAGNQDSQVMHLQALQNTGMEIYKGLRGFNMEFKQLLGMFAKEELRKQIETEVAQEKALQEDISWKMKENKRSVEYISPGL